MACPRLIYLHHLLELQFFFLGFHLRQEFVIILLVLNGLFLRGLDFGQCHCCTDGKAKDGAHIGAVLLRFNPLAAFFWIFTVVLDQPTKCRKTTQTSTDRAAELTAV